MPKESTPALEADMEITSKEGVRHVRASSMRSMAPRQKPEPPRLTAEVFEDDAGEHRWRLVARNGKIVATSGEGYASMAALRNAMALLAGSAAAAFSSALSGS